MNVGLNATRDRQIEVGHRTTWPPTCLPLDIPRMSNFRPIDRDTGFLLPPSVDEWLPERHLARFVVEVIGGLDLRSMTGSYRGSGEASYHPELLLGLIVYGYATGVFSSRKLERASYDSVAFRFIAANEHPDHDTIAAFRRRFLKQIETLFVQVLSVASEMGVLKLGTVALDGTKIHANASRHSALSYEHAGKIEAQLQVEVAELMAVSSCYAASAPQSGRETTYRTVQIRPATSSSHVAGGGAREACRTERSQGSRTGHRGCFGRSGRPSPGHHVTPGDGHLCRPHARPVEASPSQRGVAAISRGGRDAKRSGPANQPVTQRLRSNPETAPGALDHTQFYHTHHWRSVALTRRGAQVFVARETGGRCAATRADRWLARRLARRPLPGLHSTS